MLGVRYRPESCLTGGRHAVLNPLVRKISAVCRQDRTVQNFYIGIASGVDYERALARRVDNYKELNGISEMILLYQSSSQRFCREVESYLIEYFLERNLNIVNRRGGRAGRPTSQPYSYVYLAVSRC